MEPIGLETRVLVLEKEMEWAKGNVESIKSDLQELKAGQYRLLEHFADLRAHTDERISSFQAHTDERISSLQAHTDERISSLQAHTDERISSLQAHTDERFSTLQAHTDAQFVAVHREIAGLHSSISAQTRWILVALLGGAILYPISLKLMDRLFTTTPSTEQPLPSPHTTNPK